MLFLFLNLMMNFCKGKLVRDYHGSIFMDVMTVIDSELHKLHITTVCLVFGKKEMFIHQILTLAIRVSKKKSSKCSLRIKRTL